MMVRIGAESGDTMPISIPSVTRCVLCPRNHSILKCLEREEQP